MQKTKKNPIKSLKKTNKSKGKKSREEKNKKNKSNQKSINKMAISTYLSIITVNVNRLNAPIKKIRW